jgi:hypothetical protein
MFLQMGIAPGTWLAGATSGLERGTDRYDIAYP